MRDYLLNEEIVCRLQKEGFNRALMEQLWEANLSFTYYKVNTYHKFGNPLLQKDDMIQVSYFAMCKAVKAYRPTAGVSFLAYYTKWIVNFTYRQELLMHRGYRMPINYKRLSCLPYVVEEDYRDHDSLVYNLGGEIFRRNPTAEVRHAVWTVVCSELDVKNATILFQRFYENKTLEEIGKAYRIGKDRVRRRINRSLQKLKDSDVLRTIAADFYDLDV